MYANLISVLLPLNLGHVIRYLLSIVAGTSGLGENQQVLAASIRQCKAALRQEAEGVWSEILPLLVALEWDRTAAGLSSVTLQSSSASVQAWMQVDSAQPWYSSSFRDLLFCKGQQEVLETCTSPGCHYVSQSLHAARPAL